MGGASLRIATGGASLRIAIVGAGVSGLVVAHLLHQTHQITLFEAADYLGGHTNTIRVDTSEETHYVDTGFIVFNDRNYPLFEQLLGRLGVAWQPSDMSFSVSDGTGAFEYASTSLDGLFAVRSNLVSPSFLRMVLEIPRFQRACRILLEEPADGPSLRTWLEQQRFSQAFRATADRSPGGGGLVGRPRPDVDLPGLVSGGILRQPRDALAT